MKRRDLSGQRFGRLTAVAFVGTSTKKSMWQCACDCGAEKLVRSTHLTGGKIKSCGCLRDELHVVRVTTHGMSKTRPYRIWRDMLNRCHYEKYPERHLYGGRGIVVCDRWRQSFEAFIADMGVPPANLSIDRIDTDGNYEPGNCKWSTAKEQARNRRKPTRRGVVFNEQEAEHAH